MPLIWDTLVLVMDMHLLVMELMKDFVSIQGEEYLLVMIIHFLIQSVDHYIYLVEAQLVVGFQSEEQQLVLAMD